MKKFAALGLSAAVVLSLAIAPSAQAKVKVTKPAAPTVASIFSSPVKKGKVNVTFAITLPTNAGGAKITGSKVRAGGKSCTIKGTKTSCTIKGITNGQALNVIAQTKNKKGFSARSVGVLYVAGAAAFSASVTPAAVIPATPVVPVTPVVTVPAPSPPAPTPSATPFITSWGNNDEGQLGNASTTNSNVPVALSTTGVLTGKTITATSAGGNHTCAITSEATNNAYCWGWNGNGQLGNASTTGSNTPVAVDVSSGGALIGKKITAISAGGYHTCAITTEAINNVYCWGWNAVGQLGNASTTGSNTPVAVSTVGVLIGKTITEIDAGDSHTCALTSDVTNNAYCWGRNLESQLGNASTTSSNIPVAVSTVGVLIGKTITEIDAGDSHTCALTSDATNNAYCWGRNLEGQLGNASTTSSNIPVAVSTVGVLIGKTITEIDAGGYHTCAITTEAINNVYCWGWNAVGQLGNALTTSSNIPVAVGVSSGGALIGKKITAISTGFHHTCALKSEATNNAYCWGGNGNGQLGNASTTSSNIPVAVSTVGVLSGKTTTAISAGYYHTSAIAN